MMRHAHVCPCGRQHPCYRRPDPNHKGRVMHEVYCRDQGKLYKVRVTKRGRQKRQKEAAV